MRYLDTDIEKVRGLQDSDPNPHQAELLRMMEADEPHQNIFEYGKGFLPRILDEKTGKVNLDLLNGYVPQVVGYFNLASELESLPEKARDLATDMAAYADGESVQNDEYYFGFDPEREIKGVFQDCE